LHLAAITIVQQYLEFVEELSGRRHERTMTLWAKVFSELFEKLSCIPATSAPIE